MDTWWTRNLIIFKTNNKRKATTNTTKTILTRFFNLVSLIVQFCLIFPLPLVLPIAAIFICLITIIISILLFIIIIEFVTLLWNYLILILIQFQFQFQINYAYIFTGIDFHEHIQILNIIIPLSCLVTNNNEIKKNTNKKTKTKTYNLSLGYGLNSPLFKELIKIITNNPLNHNTQLRIEQFLQQQASELINLKLSTKNNSSLPIKKTNFYVNRKESVLRKNN